MTLDSYLIIGVGMATSAQGFLGLLVTTRPPSEIRRIYYEVAFGILGLVGLCCAVWGGIRGGKSANNVESSLGAIASAQNGSEQQLTRIASALALNPNQSAETLANEILSRLPSATWHLDDNGKNEIGSLLDAVPQTSRFKLRVSALPSSTASSTMAQDLAQLFVQHGWDASLVSDFGVPPDLAGFSIGVSSNIKTIADIPYNARVLNNIISPVSTKNLYTPLRTLVSGEISLVVGLRPTSD